MSGTLRTFIAIPMGPSIQKTASDVQEDLKRLFLDVKWVKPPQIHLTLKFLGDVEEEKIATIKQIMAKHLPMFKAFDAQLTQAGAFPSARHPQIIWLGLKDVQGEIKKIVELLENELEQAGFKKESRDFHPHVTIGRVRSQKNIRALSEKLGALSLPPTHERIERVILFKSTLGPGGPAYEELASIWLSS